MTVRGPISPDEIGPTTMHDHVFSDARQAWWAPESFEDPELTDLPLAYRDSGLARWNALGIADNLLLGVADYEDQLREIQDFKAAGGSCLVDLTNVGISPAPAQLKSVSEALDLHVVAGCGFYVHPTHLDWLEEADVDQIAERIDDQVRVGLEGTGVLPGIIGEIGTSGEFYDCEQRVIRAAARVAASTGTAMNVDTTATAKHAMEILELVTAESLDPRRLVFSHLDEVLDRDYHHEVLSSGATIGFDSFGCDVYFGGFWKSPSDMEKTAGLLD